MFKAYKYRLYPNKEQQEYFKKCFGCVRFIYNRMLADKIEYYKETKCNLNNTPAQYKKEFEWLKEVDSLALANAQMNLQSAYNNFFKRPEIGFPKFKTKKNYFKVVFEDNLEEFINKAKISYNKAVLFMKIINSTVFEVITDLQEYNDITEIK